MGFEKEKPGTVLVTFDDGSAIVRGDGSPEERRALLRLLKDGGCDEAQAKGIAGALLDQGLSLARRASGADDPRVMSGETFVAISARITDTN